MRVQLLAPFMSVAVVLAAVPRTAPAAAPPTSSNTAIARNDEDLALRIRAGLLRAEDERNATEPAITAALASPLGELRARAYRALGRIGDPISVPLVSRGLVDNSREAQREAVFALGEIESPAALQALTQAFNSDDPEQRVLAAEALAKIPWKGSDRARAGGLVLTRALRPDTEADPDVIARALRSSWRFGPETPGLVAAVGNLYLRQEPAITEAAVFAAARLADPGVAPLLELALKDSRPQVRALGCRGLGRLARGKNAESHVSLPRRSLLLTRAMDVDPDVRLAALSALEPFPPAEPAIVTELLSASLASGDAELQRAALTLVGAWRATSAREAVLLTMQRDTLEVLPETLAALVRIEGAMAVPMLASFAKSPDWRRRVAVAEALGDKSLGGNAEATALQDLLLKDLDPRVVAATLASIGENGRHDAAVKALAHLGAPDVVVRAVAASLLPTLVGDRLSKAEAAGALRRAWREAASDESADARLSSIEALSDLLGADAGPDLLVAAGQSEWVMRLKARQLMTRAGMEALPLGTTGMARPLPFYLEMARQEVSGERRLLRLDTDRGIVDVELATPHAPMTVFQITELARRKYFDGLMFHRVVGDFVAQAGCPRGDGWGGPPMALRCEVNRLPYDRGAAGMALSGKDTGGSQFFFTLSPQPHLDGGYTVFGHVTPQTMPVVDAIRRFDLIRHATVVEDAPASRTMDRR